MTSLQSIRLVARREFKERVRERSFAISTVVTVLILLAVILLPALFSGEDDPAGVGLVRGSSAELAELVSSQEVDGERVEVRVFANASSAELAVREGDVDAAIAGEELLSEDGVSGELELVLQGVSAEARARAGLEQEGITGERADAILASVPLAERELDPGGGDDEKRGIAFVAVLILYGQLFAYGYWVAAGVVEEKASRVVELILATMRPRDLLAGKIVGIGLLGLLQLFLIAVLALVVGIGSGVVDAPREAIGVAGIAVGWFVLGYAFYSCLFAAAGSSVSRVEELQNAVNPLSIVLIGSFLLSFAAINDPDGGLARIASLIPPVSAMVMPPRVPAGDVPAWEIALSTALMLAAIGLLVPLAGRIYANTVLRTGGRVRLREAWRP